MTASARQLTKAVVAEKPRSTYGTCAYCGTRCFGFSCQAHSDLPQLEHEIYAESNETVASLDPGAATVSQPKGV